MGGDEGRREGTRNSSYVDEQAERSPVNPGAAQATIVYL